MLPKELMSILQDIGMEEETKEDIIRVLENVLRGNYCNLLLAEYFENISHDDVKYERLMQFLRLFRNPIIQGDRHHRDLVGAFVSSIKNGAPLRNIINHFATVLISSVYIEKPIIYLQRRSFTL